MLPTLNRLRQSLGLSPIAGLRDWLFFGTPSLALYPAWFDDLGALAAEGIRQGDFILSHVDESDVSDESLIRFLDAGAPPVVCTLGTGIAHAGERYAQVARTLTRMGRRGVFVTPFDKNIQTELGPHIMRVGYANLAALLRRSSLLIHHGGVGTMSQAFRAATPQLIMPFYYDQSDNGDRVRKLGAGRMLEARVPEADALAQAIEYCSTLDKAQLDSLRARAFSGGGARTCYRALQELLLQAGATSECQWQATEQEVRS
jgi:rhamnosyltransferase subunit B